MSRGKKPELHRIDEREMTVQEIADMLGITKIKVMNLVPACLMPILLCRIL